jgi:DNA gyrase subunit B
MLAAQARHAAAKAREMVQTKNSNGWSWTSWVNLSDCSEKDPAICELYLSRGRFCRRNCQTRSEIEITKPYYPLRGKILNVEKALRA